MQFIPLLLIGAVVFSCCFLLDKGFSKLFRNKKQHESGLSVKLNKRYALFGIAFFLVGLLGIFTGIGNGVLLIAGGVTVMLLGIGLVVYYISFGIFYDADTFLLTAFGKKSTVYRFEDIRAQKLYTVTGGQILVDLQLADGSSVGLQSAMQGMYPFLDHAFSAWCRQKGIEPETCEFHDPSQSLWFPTEEDK